MSTIKVDTIATRTGSGNITASNTIAGNLTGNVTGNVTGNLTGNSTVGGTLGVTGNTTITSGNLVIATAGKGIDFSAASGSASGSSSAILDDYEEGTWTPTVTVAGSGMSFNVQQGTYLKVGNMVRAQFYLNATGGTMAGQGLKFGTLPFTPIGSHYTVGFGYNNTSGSSITHPILIVFPNDTNIWYYEQGGNGVSQVTGSTLGNNLSQLWTMIYQST